MIVGVIKSMRRAGDDTCKEHNEPDQQSHATRMVSHRCTGRKQMGQEKVTGWSIRWLRKAEVGWVGATATYDKFSIQQSMQQ